MKTEINGHLAMLDGETGAQIVAARDRLFGRLRERVAELDLNIQHVAATGTTLCQVTVRTANRIQILARHRDRDVLQAVVTALQRARSQAGRAFRRASRPGVHGLSASVS